MAPTGAKVKTILLEERGIKGSFINNLIASANGWNTPNQATLLGPLRDCLRPKIFRSKRVKKATLIKTGITTKTLFKAHQEINLVSPSRLQCDALLKLQKFKKL